MKKKLMIIVLTFVLAIGIVGCANEDSNQPISRTEIFMSTPVSITIYDGEDENILDKAFEKVEEVEELVSINKENTEISELNKNAGVGKVKLSGISYDILKKGLEYSKLSNGSYDITIGPLVKLWNIGFEDAKVPSMDEINEVISSIDYNNIEINDTTKEVFLTKKGMEKPIPFFHIGAANGTRTRTTFGHKHLKLACLPIPAQPHMNIQLYSTLTLY